MKDGIVQKNLEVLSLEEGCFKNGKKNGYCRKIDAVTGVIDVGFYKNDKPNGKFMRFKNNQVMEEGIYRN